ncbi:flippase [Hymenobacter sp. HDW8]|uniref:flippase n=1 Tax=Hymenobacter sp. HDW8 TaxID=2714932 RepID=UPI001409D396|nr:flippase [Hymenobacter sp. HDW8]QIL77333.1 flippase [Hymenobacter sp. HDW8]
MAALVKENSSLFKNFLSLSLLQAANNVLPIISIPIIVRIIGPDKFGVINFASVVMSFFILLTNYGFDLTATRAIAMNRNSVQTRSNVFNEVLYAKLLLFGVSLLIFLVLLNTIPQLREEKLVAIYSFILVFSFVLTPSWLYQGMQELYNIAIFNFITKLLFTVCVLIVIREKQDYIWQPFLIGVAHIIVGVVAFIWAIRKYDISLFYVPLKKVLRHIWNERVIFFSFISINVYSYAPTLILGLVQSSEAVAFFSAAWRLVVIMHTTVTIPLGMALFPYIGENFGISREKGIERIQMTAPFIVYLTVLMGAGVWLLAPFIITIFYGNAFHPSITVLRILCFIPVLMGMSNLMGVQTMVNLKMDKPYTKIIALGGIIGLALNLLLTSQFSYLGAAWAWLLTELSIALIMWIYLRKKGIQVLNSSYFRYTYVSEAVVPMVHSLQQKFGRKPSN